MDENTGNHRNNDRKPQWDFVVCYLITMAFLSFLIALFAGVFS